MEGNAKTRMGHRLEPIIIASMVEEHGWILRANAETKVDSILPWLGATPDALEYHDTNQAPVGVGECKAVGADNQDWTDEEIPDYVLIQVTVQMHVARVKRARVGKLVGTDFATYTVELDTDLDTAILERCDRFKREHLDRNVPPSGRRQRRGYPHAGRLVPAQSEALRGADAGAGPVGQGLSRGEGGHRDAGDVSRRIEQKFKLALADAEGVNGPGWKARWPTVEAAHVKAYERKAYRRFTLTKESRA